MTMISWVKTTIFQRIQKLCQVKVFVATQKQKQMKRNKGTIIVIQNRYIYTDNNFFTKIWTTFNISTLLTHLQLHISWVYKISRSLWILLILWNLPRLLFWSFRYFGRHGHGWLNIHWWLGIKIHSHYTKLKGNLTVKNNLY